MKIPIEWKIIPDISKLTKWVPMDGINFETSGGADKECGVPAGTSAALNHAFSNHLSRAQGWAALENSQYIEALTTAARIYRRGVHFKIGTNAVAPSEKSGNYDIVFSKVSAFLQEASQRDGFFVVDEQVSILWPVVSKLSPVTLVRSGEENKTLQLAAKLRRDWDSAGRPKEWIIIGGGLVADVGAFAAALEQCEFTLIPTTLLAMIDACVGGKTGANYPPYGKNQVGLFAFPREVIVDVNFLETLDARQLRSGIAEGLKHAILLGDRVLCEDLVDASKSLSITAIKPHMTRLIDFKARIVQQDPDERGIRAILNFGHTLGHALETISTERNLSAKDRLTHGEGVALGMIFALLLSREHAGLNSELCRELIATISNSAIAPKEHELCGMLGLSSEGIKHLWPEISGQLRNDKKNQSNSKAEVDWILLSDFGKVLHQGDRYTHSIDVTTLEHSWLEFLNHLH